jgi:hypothetical protein
MCLSTAELLKGRTRLLQHRYSLRDLRRISILVRLGEAGQYAAPDAGIHSCDHRVARESVSP